MSEGVEMLWASAQWPPLSLLGLDSGLQVATGVGGSGALEDGNYFHVNTQIKWK